MKKISLGTTGLQVSNIAFGTGNFKEKISKETAFDLLDYYLELGGNFIDTANVYCRWLPDTENSSEQWLGEWLRSRKSYDRVVIASKGGHYSLSDHSCRVTKQELTRDLDESLRTLGLEYLDFYWFHRDNEVLPIEEVVEIGEYFVKEGKIRFYGASNYKLDRMKAAVSYAETIPGNGFSALSNQWSLAYANPGKKLINDPTLVDIDADYYQWLVKTGFPLIPFSASACGFYRKLECNRMPPAVKAAYDNERNMALYSILQKLQETYSMNMAALSMVPLLSQTFPVVPVTSFSNRQQMDELLSASDVTFSDEELSLINPFFI